MSSETSKRCVTLSAKGLNHINRENYENDFKFIVSGGEYVCPSFVAEFLSNRVSKYRRNDCTIFEIELELNIKPRIESKDISNCFNKFISLGFGSSIFFESTEYACLQSICIELESIELYEILFMDPVDLNEGNVIARLKYGELIGHSCEIEIAFAASHFLQMELSSICELSVSMLFQIFGDKSLQLENEDDLYEMILSLISRESCYSKLLECVKYEYLSVRSIESFIDLICESFEFLTLDIWHCLRSRLVSGRSSSMNGRHYGCIFEYREGSSFEGIIAFLTRKHGGNVHDLDIVSVTSSSVHCSCAARNVVDFNNSSIAHTDGGQNEWICFDFKEKQVNLHH
jgi:hypothetical protein